MNQKAKCSQCSNEAVGSKGQANLCVDHYTRMVYADYMQMTMLAAVSNQIAEKIDAGAGYIVRSPRIYLPPPPHIGGTMTLNNINVAGDNLGLINTGTVQHLDSHITISQSRGNEVLAGLLKQFSEALISDSDVEQSAANEAAELLDNLLNEVSKSRERRSPASVVKAMFGGIPPLISASTSLTTLWGKLEPHIKQALTVVN